MPEPTPPLTYETAKIQVTAECENSPLYSVFKNDRLALLAMESGFYRSRCARLMVELDAAKRQSAEIPQ